MELPIEKKISSLIPQMFPSFYAEEGPIFIAFVKAYYAWMEEQNNPTYLARRLPELTDIDDTLESFLEHFQKKYLYGIPFNVIINKRYLLKHVLDVYRSKSSVQCFKLLFRLIYNQDVEVYLPGIDLLRPSDGTWVEPKYLEISDPEGNASDLVGKTIIGVSSRTTAVVESFITEPVNQNIIATLFISNMNPRGGAFNKGEKIVLYDDRNSEDLAEILGLSPTILGSLDTLEIINGGQDFSIGDILAIAHKDPSGNIISFGVGGKVRVTGLGRGQGQLSFTIVNPGFGFTTDANTWIYNNESDANGQNASFQVGAISFTQLVEYNTDIWVDYSTMTWNSAAFGFPGNSSANANSSWDSFLSFANNTFGSIATLDNVRTGNGYTHTPYTFVRDVLQSKNLAGSNVVFNTGTANVTGTNTAFDLFQANDCVILKSNGASNATARYHIIKSVTNATHMILYGKPSVNSTANATYHLAPAIFPANFAIYDDLMVRADGTINGLNANVFAFPGTGNNVVNSVKAVDSGKGYVESELVYLYLSDSITTPLVLNAGAGYINNTPLVFSGGNPAKAAQGYITTNGNGAIITPVITYPGCGYQSIPEIRVTLGSGAHLETTIQHLSLSTELIGKIVKSSVGRQRGRWTTTRSFLNSDKYIQDSYYYQDFSYELKVATTLDKYRSILYDTFHIAGAEMFGKYDVKTVVSSPISVLYCNSTPEIS